MPNITPARRAPSASIKLAELDGAIVAWPVPRKLSIDLTVAVSSR
jgi:hypothetical protein